jgi:hypothetical protein
MRNFLVSAAAVAALFVGAGAAGAQQLLYSFESGDSPNSKDGFVPNGLFPSSSTIGATNGSGSLELNDTTGGSYVGAYTQNPIPAVLDTPDVTGFTADVTFTSPLPGTSNDIGLGFFIFNAGESEYGDQFIAPTSAWAVLPTATPGTYSIFVPLLGTNPDTTLPDTWPDMLSKGWAVGGFNVVSSNNAGAPFAFYIDNIQAVVPEPASLSLGAVSGLMLLARRRRSA